MLDALGARSAPRPTGDSVDGSVYVGIVCVLAVSCSEMSLGLGGVTGGGFSTGTFSPVGMNPSSSVGKEGDFLM